MDYRHEILGSVLASAAACAVMLVGVYLGWFLQSRIVRYRVIASVMFAVVVLLFLLVAFSAIYMVANWWAQRQIEGLIWVHPGRLWFGLPVLTTILAWAWLAARPAKRRGQKPVRAEAEDASAPEFKGELQR